MVKARPTVFKGIEMRSRLEAGFAAWLDEWKVEWTYEPSAFANHAGQYLPDFKLDLRCSWRQWELCAVYLDVKPASWPYREDDRELLYRSMAIIWDSEPEAILLVVQQPAEADRPKWAEVGMLNAKFSPIDDPCFPWPQVVLWARGPDGQLGLAAPLEGRRGPWAKEYWRVQL